QPHSRGEHAAHRPPEGRQGREGRAARLRVDAREGRGGGGGGRARRACRDGDHRRRARSAVSASTGPAPLPAGRYVPARDLAAVALLATVTPSLVAACLLFLDIAPSPV